LYLLFIFSIYLIFLNSVHAEEPKKTLNLQEIISIALRNHPLLRQGKAQIDQAKGAEIQVRSNYKPQVGFQSLYAESSSLSNIPGTNSLNFGQSSLAGGFVSSSISSSISFNQLITDFGKTSASIRSVKENVTQAQEQLLDTVQQVLLNVFQAYFSVLQNQAQVKVQEDSVDNLKRHLNKSETFFEVGTKPRIDVTQAKLNLSNGLLALEQVNNALAVAKIHLNTTMGVSNFPPYEIKGELTFEDFSYSLKESLEKAFENRHDLRALMARKKSMENNLLAALKGQNPSLSGNGSYLWKSSDATPLLPSSWNYGISLNFSVYNGGFTSGAVQQAKGQVDAIQAQIDNLKLSIEEIVTQNYLNLESARRSYKVAQESVELARENLDLAQQRYDVGVGSFLEYSDAQLAFVKAENNRIQTLANYNIAIAALKAAMGILE